MFMFRSGVLNLAKKLESENTTVGALHEQAKLDWGLSIEEVLDGFRREHSKKAFGRWKTQIKATLDPQEQPHYGCTVRRLLYRLVAMTCSLLWKFVVQ